jgi:motility quorum-sensing regulator / GCU-specific mRNA interferase toxin
MRSATPTYDLRRVQQLVGQGPISSRITRAARRGATELLLDEFAIVEAVLALTPTDFYKSMEAEKCPGLWQDVYHLQFRGLHLYIKLQIAVEGLAVVVQFKEK